MSLDYFRVHHLKILPHGSYPACSFPEPAEVPAESRASTPLALRATAGAHLTGITSGMFSPTTTLQMKHDKST